jgi:hypothetical protein
MRKELVESRSLFIYVFFLGWVYRSFKVRLGNYLKDTKCLQMYELIIIIVDLCTRFLQLEPCEAQIL